MNHEMKLATLLVICGIFVTACGDSTTNADATVAVQADAATTQADALVVVDDAAAATANDDAAAAVNDAAAGSPDAAALLAFGAICTMNEQCETGLCAQANMGLVCTAMCVNNVCPVAGHQCNMRGICRP